MAKFQVVEKADFGTDWQQVRYQAYAMKRFDAEEEAIAAAKQYLTYINCENSLTAAEKQSGAEAFMMTDAGCFMGVLDGKDWYLSYPKDIVRRVDGETKTVHAKGDPVKDKKYYELEGKTEVAVREVRGT